MRFRRAKLGGAGMHRSEAEGRFGEAEPEGRASVCAEPILRSVGVQDKMERASWECGAVNYPDAPPAFSQPDGVLCPQLICAIISPKRAKLCQHWARQLALHWKFAGGVA